MFQNILYSTKDSVGYVTINRPAVRNALNAATVEELRLVFEQIRDDPNVSGVIITGSGDQAFVAGADINEIAALTPLTASEYVRKGQAVFDSIENLGKPVIAAVNGYALGGGCELAMACTLRVASENAFLGQPEVKLGIIPGYGGTQRLPRLIGKGLALQILLTGEMVSASEALRMGLVNQVVPQAELIAVSEALLKKIMGNALVAVKFCIESVHRGLDMTLAQGQLLERKLFDLCCSSEDMVEGTRAFREKRKANFKGR